MAILVPFLFQVPCSLFPAFQGNKKPTTVCPKWVEELRALEA
jgi:hypothetical protein